MPAFPLPAPNPSKSPRIDLATSAITQQRQRHSYDDFRREAVRGVLTSARFLTTSTLLAKRQYFKDLWLNTIRHRVSPRPLANSASPIICC